MPPINSSAETWLVAIDDDPTGCQSVSGVPLLTSWDDDSLAAAARRRAPVTFILTNSRALPESEAVAINREVGAALVRVAEAHGVRLSLISRSDSTLRGHFPAEVDALVEGAGLDLDGIVICPAFFEAGRFTADGIHWVEREGQTMPACETEFAADATFGFSELTLADWARARGVRDDVIDIGLDELNGGDVQAVTAKLASACDRQAIVVNATSYDNLECFMAAARLAEADGSTFVYRSAPSLVRAAAGLGEPALAAFDNGLAGNGLVVVGSHTDVTNSQVEGAVASHGLHLVELDAETLLDPAAAGAHRANVVDEVGKALGHGSVLLRTSRTVITGSNSQSPLEVSRTIADAVTDVVREIASANRLAWVVAKGGITSHDLLTSAFDVSTAEVLGQALPGIIPVLEIRVVGYRLPFVIFPGNVGDASTMSKVLERLTAF